MDRSLIFAKAHRDARVKHDGGGIWPHVRRLLDLPGGLRFSSILITCPIGDVESVADLVLEWSDILVSLRIGCHSSGAFPHHLRLTCTLSTAN